ncbi:MAG TPA: UDP-3-O-(3-hydroxymyristoyl)glucosamine N-acyltransferase [Pyrinomonadaceae bacterium]|nr:UDP-3-O-(3-hydroxymyristoyl)glucosamine N-acyltransferase [Pyrinomonadaceae bacterium]
MKLAELAEKTRASIERGAPDLEIAGAAGLDIAESGDVTFLANPKYTPQVQQTRASAIFLNEREKIERTDIAVLRAKDPYLAYTRALRLLNPEPETVSFIHPRAVISPTARIAPGVEIQANAVVGENCVIESGTKIFPNVTVYDNVKIGKNCRFHSGVSIRENSEIGDNVIIHNNTTIGSDGFGYAKDEEKRWLKIPQTGRVVIESDVEIGANSAVDCASVGETRIRRGVKIDNLVQIGHSCTVEEDSLICAQTGLAGTSVIGRRVILAGQVGIAGHLKVGDDAVVTAKSATSHNVENGKIISGIPAFDNRDWLRSIAAFRRLGEMARALRELTKKVNELEQKV